jgi:hypothetical protein
MLRSAFNAQKVSMQYNTTCNISFQTNPKFHQGGVDFLPSQPTKEPQLGDEWAAAKQLLDSCRAQPGACAVRCGKATAYIQAGLLGTPNNTKAQVQKETGPPYRLATTADKS